MRYPTRYLLLSLCCGLLMACHTQPDLPTQYTQVEEQATLYPDYRDIVVPPNIAPLNFQVQDDKATAYVVEMKGKQGEPLLLEADEEGVIQIDTTDWRALLQANKGEAIEVNVYAERDKAWVRYRPHNVQVAEEPIDPYLSYRLIEPGYELYRQLGLYQRNLTNWDVQTIYENNRSYSEQDNHCINCHNYQNYSTERMLFHVRANHGGTVMIHDGKAEKVIIKDSTILTAGVYPTWHPTQDWVVFSTNRTGQAFHLYHEERIEVLDGASDLLFYDVSKNEVKHILRTKDHLETFPVWAPDGKTLYYCCADVPELVNIPDSLTEPAILPHYRSIRYNLMRMSFDASTQTFGQPELVLDCAAQQKSASVPRISPDGRFLLYTLGDYGQFHIWHKSSDQWVKDLQQDTCYALSAANSPDVDSYHTWSSNGRWIVFSSRRMDGNYTRPHIAYFDKQGRAHKAFCLPQEDPRQNLLLLKSYNVPELTKDAIRVSPETLKECIYHTEGKPAHYQGKAPANRLMNAAKASDSIDTHTAASAQQKVR